MRRNRRKKYHLLRRIRRERDYRSGRLFIEGRVFIKPSMTIKRNGLKPYFRTTKQFIAENELNV